MFNLLAIVFAFNSVWAAPAGDAKMNQFIDKLMAKMTLEEKVGQLNQYTAEMALTGEKLNANYRDDVAKGRVGSILNAYTVEVTRALQKIAVEETRLKIPLLFGYDVIHGHRTIFPIPLGESASWNLELIEKSARLAAKEASADGIHWTFAPMVDVSRDPRWGRISEGAGEDTWLGTKIAVARVRGFQGNDTRSLDSLYACVKHFAAYGAPVAGRDYNTVDMSERELFETYLPPYEAAIKAGAWTVMTAFNELNGIPATGHSWLYKDLLRDKWKFKGFVVTDYTAIEEMVPHGFAEDKADAGRKSFLIGADMDMQSEAYLRHLPDDVRKGRVPMAKVNQSVRRILEAKYRRGLFEDPYRFSNAERAKQVIGSQEMIDHARDAARRSMVLLKNDNNVLPLKRDGNTIALIGPHAANKVDQLGNWPGTGDWKQAVSLVEGMTANAKDKTEGSKKSATIITAPGSNMLLDGMMRDKLVKIPYFASIVEISPRPLEDMEREAIKVAKKADVIVMALGETQGMSGEAASRSMIRIPENQLALLKKIKAETKKPIVLVVYNGRPLALETEAGLVDAIVVAWFPGSQSGNAIADVLYGDYNPSGKLPVTFPRNEGQIPIYYSAKMTGRPEVPSMKYRSKYLDVDNSPLYPFGYGLSYTKFEISEPKLSSNKISPSEKLKVAVTVKNVGERDGEETVQMYVRDVVASVTRPVKQLRGFQKVFLKKGESREIAMELKVDDLKFYDQKMKWIYEPGAFKVFVGPDSENVKTADFTLTAPGSVAPRSNIAEVPKKSSSVKN